MVTAVANVTMRESKARSTMQKRAGHSLPRFIVSRSISNSDKTKWRIVGALEKALKKKPFNKVNVVDMTDECHIARQTFYNHFLDKQDVVNWLNMQLDMKTFGRIGIDLTWREAVRMKLEIMKAKQHLFASLYEAESTMGLFSNEANITFENYVANITRITGKTLNTHESALLKIYCYGTSRLIAEWIMSGTKEPIAELMQACEHALPLFVQRIFLASY